MARRRSSSFALADFPPTLRYVVKAAEIECPRGHAEALTDLTAFALHKVPVRGIFDPGTREEPELFMAVEAAAEAHLGLSAALRRWRTAIKAADLPLERRDTIETAALHVRDISDTAYFYAGVAFGLTFMSLHEVP